MKPAGWVRFGVKCDAQKDWCVCYHGTNVKSALSILSHGLKRPGADGVKVAHGQAGSESKQTIYVTPSIEYAAFPTYGNFFELEPGRWAQVVLQCRIRPDSFVEQPGTLGGKHWPQDLPFEWTRLRQEEMRAACGIFGRVYYYA